MPRSRAILRASGEALMRPSARAGSATGASGSGSGDGGAPAFGSASSCGGGAASFGCGASSASTETSSPSSPITAIVRPTSTSPSETAILSRTPEASASTSCVTLSVSSSYSGSPFSTLSPSDLSHLTIVPDSMPCPRRGSLISVAIATHSSLDGREHVVGVRNDPLLHHRGERERRELCAHALDRRVEPIEGAVLDHGRDLGAEAHPRHCLVRDDAAVRLLHRRDERVLVERLQRSRIDHLNGDALLFGLLRRRQRLVHEPPGGDDRDVLPLAMDARLAERNRLELVRHLLLQAVE